MKSLAKELIKIAINLDNMGFVKEASNLDKIAQKIVVSADYNTEPSLNYSNDLKNYEMMVKAKSQDSGLNGFAATLIDNHMKAFIDKIMEQYKSPQKEAFLLQAKNIKHAIENRLNSQDLNTKLYSLLRSQGIVDKYSNKLIYTNRDEFRTKWMDLIQPEFDINNNNAVAQWLINKFNLLALQCK